MRCSRSSDSVYSPPQLLQLPLNLSVSLQGDAVLSSELFMQLQAFRA